MKSGRWGRICCILSFLVSLKTAAQPAEERLLNPQGLGAFAIEWNGKTPPAALVRFEGQSLNTKAYVLGCGHCNGMPVGDYVVNRPIDRRVYLYGPDGRQKSLPVTRIVYGTQTVVDLVLLELAQTYNEIKEMYGIDSRMVAREPFAVGGEMAFYNLEGTQYCRVDEVRERIDFNDEGTDYLEDAYIYYDCVSRPGYSGSILIARETDRIFGLNVAGSYPEKRDGRYLSYGSEVTRLYSCLDEQARFSIEQADCRLRF